MPAASRPSSQAGFSLIELLVTLTIAGMVLLLALPSFTNTIERNRIVTQTNDFIAATMMARSEAIRRNRLTGVCASADQQVCGGAWTEGWIVWADLNLDGGPDVGEALRTGSFNTADTVDALVNDIRFNARGLRSLPAAGNVELVLKPADCASGQANMARRVIVNLTGSVSTEKPSC